MTEVGPCTKTLSTAEGDITIYSLRELEAKGIVKDLSKIPYSVKILIEGMLRQRDGTHITDDDVVTAASWNPVENTDQDIPWIPARVLLQDLTGGAVITDLASMRAAVAAMGKDPELINPLMPVDLVIDHSVNTDYAGRDDAQELNEELDFQRNKERYALFKWAQKSLKNFRAVPPGNGICHQVNLEYLSPLVHVKDVDGRRIAYPDSCFGTDSHTTQIDGLGVLGWGVGGIEAEAAMVGQPSYMKLPDVVGFKLTGKLKEGVNATDLVLTVVNMLRKKGVVGKFVEYYGEGYRNLDLADRSTLANMGPEYGATTGFCPVDGKTIDYLRLTGRSEDHIDTIEIMLSKLYRKFGITERTNFNRMCPEDYPILSDLYDLIEEEFKTYDADRHQLYTQKLLQEVLLGLHSMCKGADAQFFNGHTNITSSRFLVFGVKGMLSAAKNVRNAMLFNVLSFMSDKLLTVGNTVAALDELYIWLSNPTAIEYIRNCLKRVRKKESAMLLASQNLEDFDQEGVREMTKPLFSIPPHQFLFNAGSIDKRSYMDMLQLEESEYNLIKFPQRGVCLYKCGNERYLLEVHAPAYKEKLFGTAGGR